MFIAPFWILFFYCNDSSLVSIFSPNCTHGIAITKSIQAIANIMTGTNVSKEPNPKCPRYLKFEQLSHNITTSTMQVHSQKSSSQTLLFATPPACFLNTKYECANWRSIEPTYEGSEDHLMPFLKGGHQWQISTVSEKVYELTCKLAYVTNTNILAQFNC